MKDKKKWTGVWEGLDEMPWVPGIILGAIYFFALIAIDHFWG